MSCPYCTKPLHTASQSAYWIEVCPSCLNAVLRDFDRGTGHFTKAPGLPDVRDLAPAGSAMNALLRHVPKAVDQMPTLHGVPQRVLALIHDPLSGLDEVADVVNQDPALTVQVLRAANSVLYGGGQDVQSIRVACSRLGVRTLANLAVASAARPMFQSRDPRFRALLEAQWRHAVAVAFVAGKLENLVSKDHVDALFLAGLLHDVGKALLLLLIATPEFAAPEGLRSSDSRVHDVLDNFHALLGLHVMVGNGLPDELRAAALFHHHPEAMAESPLKAFVYAVALSNQLAHEAGYGEAEPEPEDSAPVAEFFGMGTARRIELTRTVNAEIADAVEMLSV